MIRHVLRRELRARTGARSYRIGTLLLLVVAVAAPVALAVFDDGGTSRRTVEIGVVGADAAVVDALAAAGDAPGSTVDYEVRAFPSRADAESALEDGDVAAVLDGGELVWAGTVDVTVTAGVAAARRQAAATAWAADNDVDPATLAELDRASVLEPTLLDDDRGEAQGVRTGVAFLTAIATFVIIVTYGPLVATSVVEEKSTRVVEVLLSRLTAGQLLAGKVAGVGVAVFVQVVIVLGGLAGALAATASLEVPASVWGALPVMLAALVLGFALYAVLYAAAGSLVSRQEDVQQTTMPLMIPIFAAYFYASFTLAGDVTWVHRVLGFVPFTSPVVLPGLYARDALTLPETLVSLAVLAVATLVAVRVAAGVYERSLLRTGSKVPWREALRPGTGRSVPDPQQLVG
jgi:ABC-2 type transport system permease protein